MAAGSLHPACEQGHPHPKGGEQAVQVLGVLAGQDLGRRQKRCLIPGPDAGPDGRSGHQRLSAAHVALQEPVHGGLTRHIGQDLFHGPPLCTGGRKGESVPEGGGVGLLHGCAGGGCAVVLHPPDAQLQDQQLFVDEPPPRREGLLLRGRAVDGPDGVGLGEQAVFFQHPGGQGVGQKLDVREELAHTFGDGAAGQPFGLWVDGLEGGGGHLCVGAHLRVDHLAAEHPAGHDALKIIFLPQLQLLDRIGIVEPCDLEAGHIIPGGDALHPPPAREDAPAGLGEYLGLHDTLGVAGSFGDGIGLREIQIPAGIVAEQVAEGQDAQLLEPLGGLRADALEVAHRSVRGEGGVRLGRHGAASFPESDDTSIVSRRRAKEKRPAGAGREDVQTLLPIRNRPLSPSQKATTRARGRK